MRGLTGKVAIVTGGAQGIGRVCMERLGEEGVAVVFSGLSAQGKTTEQELQANDWNVSFLQGDMAEERFCRALVETAIQRHGRLHLLVNNAFSFTAKGLDATRADWERVLNAGPVAYATMIQLVAPHRPHAPSAECGPAGVSTTNRAESQGSGKHRCRRPANR